MYYFKLWLGFLSITWIYFTETNSAELILFYQFLEDLEKNKKLPILKDDW